MSSSAARSAAASARGSGVRVALRVGQEELDHLGAPGGGRGQWDRRSRRGLRSMRLPTRGLRPPSTPDSSVRPRYPSGRGSLGPASPPPDRPSGRLTRLTDAGVVRIAGHPLTRRRRCAAVAPWSGRPPSCRGPRGLRRGVPSTAAAAPEIATISLRHDRNARSAAGYPSVTSLAGEVVARRSSSAT